MNLLIFDTLSIHCKPELQEALKFAILHAQLL